MSAPILAKFVQQLRVRLSKLAPSAARIWSTFRRSVWFRVAVTVVAVGAAAGIAAGTWSVVDTFRRDVPDVTGTKVSDLRSLRVDGLTFEVTPKAPEGPERFAKVVAQDPPAGSRVIAGTEVKVEYELVNVSVPPVTGLRLREAELEIRDNGLRVSVGEAFIAQVGAMENRPGVGPDADPAAVRAVAEELGVTISEDYGGEHFAVDPDLNIAGWIVAEVSPFPGARIRAGENVTVTLRLPITQVPDAAGRSLGAAEQMFKNAGLTPVRSIAEPEGIPDGFVLNATQLARNYWLPEEREELMDRVGEEADWLVTSQSVEAGSIVLDGSRVVLEASWPTTIVPNLDGLEVQAAKEALREAGLSARDLPATGSGIVRNQSPPAGASVLVGTRVSAEARNEISFLITSSAGTGLITWIAPFSHSIQQANGAALPWAVTYNPMALPSSYQRGYISAQMDAWDGWITCSITVNGKEVISKTSTGAFAIVTCS